ncbi:LacI family DNA-binding transcriptional regulator [Curtobacterium sp. ISL-83]|uniref:LacI family DNA-binding transcriptional regulator n=1 Tax=Curtobacterium sp. ISL-83 TaxID=2819145 RepID=UPI001BE9B8E0|nr:LacI family DNA-binding transcriptional regulator [Curtobacterium sp. ISL-83]MBT2502329.1 LacI family DNA-binding transcriptional regulator [Curtobacterium sp. ISL-83]
MKRTKPASSFDVAELAGVSRATVSHVLNGRRVDRFPKETRDRVHDAAKQLGYRPSPAGRSLVNGRSDTIVVLAANTTWGRNLQDAVDQVTRDTAYLAANVVTRFAGADSRATIEAVLDLRPFAVIDLGFLSAEDHAALASDNVIAVPDRTSAGGEPAFDVDRTIVGMQIDALTTSAPRRLAFAGIADERQDPYGPRRFALLREVCLERGLAEPVLTRVPAQLDDARAALGGHFAGGPVGFACYNDDVALTVLAAARDSGLRTPDDISAVGVDATNVGQLWSPRLTTIAVDIRRLIGDAVGELRAIMDGTPAPSRASAAELVQLVPGHSS